MKCQVIEPEHDELVCPVRDGYGFRCERTDPHTAEHWVSPHTVLHALCGNMWRCISVDEMSQPIASRDDSV